MRNEAQHLKTLVLLGFTSFNPTYIYFSLSKVIEEGYFANINIEAGERFIQEFEKKCKNIVNFPNMGRSYEDVAPLLRGIPIDGHIILYKVMAEEITIVRVVSGKRDLKSLFSDS